MADVAAARATSIAYAASFLALEIGGLAQLPTISAGKLRMPPEQRIMLPVLIFAGAIAGAQAGECSLPLLCPCMPVHVPTLQINCCNVGYVESHLFASHLIISENINEQLHCKR